MLNATGNKTLRKPKNESTIIVTFAVEHLFVKMSFLPECVQFAPMNKIVALSGGKDSTAMALGLMEREPDKYEFCITPTGRELPVMMEHWKRLEDLLGQQMVRIPGPSLMDLILKYQTLPNFRMRFCTRQVKIEPFQKYAISKSPAMCLVGIRADEADSRAGTDHTGMEGVAQDCPLVRWGWDINDVRDYLRQRGVTVPDRTDCDLCFYQRLGEWWRLWRDHKDRWQEISELEAKIGHTLRSESRDSWPASLKLLGEKFQAGFIPRGADQSALKLESSERPAMCGWCSR